MNNKMLAVQWMGTKLTDFNHFESSKVCVRFNIIPLFIKDQGYTRKKIEYTQIFHDFIRFDWANIYLCLRFFFCLKMNLNM